MLFRSAFHANEGTTGIRRLYLDNGLATCLSFENRRGIFDIDSRFKFALVVARRPGPANGLRCGFYLDGIEQADDPRFVMRYDRGFIDRTGGPYQTLLELRGPADLEIAQRLFTAAETFGPWCARQGIRLGRDLHMTDDAPSFRPLDPRRDDPDWLVLHEGKTFHQFIDRWDSTPRFMVYAASLAA